MDVTKDLKIDIESPVMFCNPPEGMRKVSIKFEYYAPHKQHCFVLRWYDLEGNKLATEGLWPDWKAAEPESPVGA